MGESQLAGSFFRYSKTPKNLSRYYQTWQLRQKGKTFKEIDKSMNISKSRANFLVHFINYKIKYKKPLSNELKKTMNSSFIS